MNFNRRFRKLVITLIYTLGFLLLIFKLGFIRTPSACATEPTTSNPMIALSLQEYGREVARRRARTRNQVRIERVVEYRQTLEKELREAKETEQRLAARADRLIYLEKKRRIPPHMRHEFNNELMPCFEHVRVYKPWSDGVVEEQIVSAKRLNHLYSQEPIPVHRQDGQRYEPELIEAGSQKNQQKEDTQKFALKVEIYEQQLDQYLPTSYRRRR